MCIRDRSNSLHTKRAAVGTASVVANRHLKASESTALSKGKKLAVMPCTVQVENSIIVKLGIRGIPRKAADGIGQYSACIMERKTI